jgi:acyl-CoA synthetase (AMP-forming)/AMP-acid ligase II
MLADTLPGLLRDRGEIHPDRAALVDAASGRGRSYCELAADAERIAGTLEAHGARPGDRVVLLADHTIDAWQVLAGMSRAGVVPVLLNWRLTDDDLVWLVDDARARLVLSTERWHDLGARVAERAGAQHLSTVEVADAAAAPTALPLPAPDDVAVQMYTSGTTGLPKGVCTTHRNLMALLDVLTGELPGFASDARQLVAAPMFHIAGYGFGVGSLAVSTPMHLLDQFDPVTTLEVIERHAITHTLLVPAMLQMVVAAPNAGRTDTSSLRGLLYGGSPMSVSLMRSVTEVLGCLMTQAYGMTETTGIATLLRYDDHARGLAAGTDADGTDADVAVDRLASAGRPVLGTSVRIDAPDETGAGEILVRSPMVMAGYWQRPDETAATLVDGWLHTGDIGRLDADGYLHVVDRKKDLVITKGENVFPGEVERVVVEHPAVVEAAVIGVPDAAYGEALCAVVEVRDGSTLDLADLQEHCRGRIAGFKVPRHLEVVEVLPRTPSGKVLRRVIRDRYWADRTRQVN